MSLRRAERERFDALMERAVGALPESLRRLIEEVPVIVLDRPTGAMLRSIGADPNDEDEAATLCGLHSGHMLTERSVEDVGGTPEDIHLFREGIINLAGGFDQDEADRKVYDEIVVTLLHEIGHHFGLDEDDLTRLGYD